MYIKEAHSIKSVSINLLLRDWISQSPLFDRYRILIDRGILSSVRFIVKRNFAVDVKELKITQMLVQHHKSILYSFDIGKLA